jgi:hypothetical protein
MTALSNKDFKEGWIDGYYPYGQYMIDDSKLILGGDEVKVNNEILTQQVIKDSTSGYDKAPSKQQSGGKKLQKKYKITSDNIDSAFKKLEQKIKYTKSDILILKLESLDNNKNINFYKIYIKKI